MKYPGFISSLSGRFSEWWWYIVPFLSGIGYFFIFLFRVPVKEAFSVVLLFIVTIAATSAFGYFLNDMTDIKTDLAAGKRNLASSNSRRKNLFILSMLLLTALLPWVFLPKNRLNVSMYLLQLLLLVLYSVPPLRLKRFPVPGIITDALYNSVVPLWVVGATFFQFSPSEQGDFSVVPVFIATFWIFLKGIRGILLHQTGDRKNDRRANLRTFVVSYGPYRTFKLLFYVTFPLEVLSFTALITCLSLRPFPLLFLAIPLFLIYLFLFFRLWEKKPAKRKKLMFDILFIINDLYEEWLPLIFLVYLSIQNPMFLLILLLHTIFFHRIITKLRRNALKNRENLSDFRDYLTEIAGKYKGV